MRLARDRGKKSGHTYWNRGGYEYWRSIKQVRCSKGAECIGTGWTHFPKIDDSSSTDSITRKELGYCVPCYEEYLKRNSG